MGACLSQAAEASGGYPECGNMDDIRNGSGKAPDGGGGGGGMNGYSYNEDALDPPPAAAGPSQSMGTDAVSRITDSGREPLESSCSAIGA